MTEDIKTILRKHGCLFMADDNKEMLDEIEAFVIEREKQLFIHGVSKSFICDCEHPHHQTAKNYREYCRKCGKDCNQAN